MSEQQASTTPQRHTQQGPGPPQPVSRHLTPTTGLSSHASSRKLSSTIDIDRSAYTAGQTLVTVVNDPRADAAKSWGAWLGLGFRVPDVSWQEPPQPIDSMRYPPVTRRDFAKYLALVSEGRYHQFQQARQSLALGGISQQLLMLGGDSSSNDWAGANEYDYDDILGYTGYSGQDSSAGVAPGVDGQQHHHHQQAPDGGSGAAAEGSDVQQLAAPAPRLKQGDGLVTALQVVPQLFFNEDFSLSRPEIFEAICGCEDDNEMYERIDKLNGALDVVETQLMREIASRSRSIVSAGNCVHELHGALCNTLAHIKRLRENISDLDDVTYAAAARVAQLQRRRNNLTSTVECLKSLEEVAAAKAALPLLLESGDYAGALELLDNLSHAAGGLAAEGVAAVCSLPPQLSECRGVVVGLLQSEMLGAAAYTEAHVVLERALAESAMSLGLSQPSLTPGSTSGEALPSPSQSEALNAVPTSDSLISTPASSLRNAGSSGPLPAAAELAAAREALHDRLLPLVLGLHRCERLEPALRQFAANRAAEVKAIVREVLERLLPAPPLATAAGGPGSAGDAVSGDGGGGGGGVSSRPDLSLAERLCAMPHAGFLQLLATVTVMVEAYLGHTALMGSLVEEVLRGARVPVAALTGPRREVAAAMQGVVDVATGRWAKLMAARSDVHSRLKVYEFRALLGACESFAALAEHYGLRPGAALRPTLQAMCRSHLENTHSRCAMQVQHLLEAEQWVPAEAHSSFQAIVDRLEERAVGLRPHMAGTVAGGENGGGTAAAVGQEGGRPTAGLLRLGGRYYWPVNALLLLLKLLDEHYIGLLLPTPNQHATLPTAAALSSSSSSPTSPSPFAAPQLSSLLLARRLSGPVPSNSNSNSSSSTTISSTTANTAPPATSTASTPASWALSSLGPDVAARCLELLRTFNTVTAQQVLGAGAMRTAGLKSISARHLALAAQSLAALLAALPLLRWQLAAAVTEVPRRALLMPEFDRLAQDLNLHVEEIHVKLVDIMQERVHAACRQVASESDTWPRATPQVQAQQAAQPVPSEALRMLAKQLGTLRTVLQPILQPEEVSYIFGRVAAACSEALAGLMDSLSSPVVPPPPALLPAPSGAAGLLRGLGGGGGAAAAAAAAAAAVAAAEAHASAVTAWDASRRANALFMLQTLAGLPLDRLRASSYVTRLTTFYTKHYGPVPSDYQPRAAVLPASLPPASAAAQSSSPSAPRPPATLPTATAPAAALASASTPPASSSLSTAAVLEVGSVARAGPPAEALAACRLNTDDAPKTAAQAGPAPSGPTPLQHPQPHPQQPQQQQEQHSPPKGQSQQRRLTLATGEDGGNRSEVSGPHTGVEGSAVRGPQVEDGVLEGAGGTAGGRAGPLGGCSSSCQGSQLAEQGEERGVPSGMLEQLRPLPVATNGLEGSAGVGCEQQVAASSSLSAAEATGIAALSRDETVDAEEAGSTEGTGTSHVVGVNPFDGPEGTSFALVGREGQRPAGTDSLHGSALTGSLSSSQKPPLSSVSGASSTTATTTAPLHGASYLAPQVGGGAQPHVQHWEAGGEAHEVWERAMHVQVDGGGSAGASVLGAAPLGSGPEGSRGGSGRVDEGALMAMARDAVTAADGNEAVAPRNSLAAVHLDPLAGLAVSNSGGSV